MKLKNLPRALGFAASPRQYPTRVEAFTLPSSGEIQFARWLHPAETPKTVTEESVNALRAFLREGDVAIDIGAHTGDSTVPMALAVGPRGTVFALEPNPYVFEVLDLNATLNPTKCHIVPLMFAAMPYDGLFDFDYSDSGYCNGGYHPSLSRWTHGEFLKLRVEGRDLVKHLRRTAESELARLRYIKIDTEGFDRAVAGSLNELLKSARPYLKSEIYKHMPNNERAGYYADLRSLGYRIFKCEESSYRGEELGPDDLTRWRHFDIFAVPEELA